MVSAKAAEEKRKKMTITTSATVSTSRELHVALRRREMVVVRSVRIST